MSITKEKKAELVKKFGGNEKNTGSVASQVAILTEEIKQITDHVKAHAKDFSSKRGLYKKVVVYLITLRKLTLNNIVS